MKMWILIILLSWTIAGATNLSGRLGIGYFIQVNLGTPPQSFNVLVDTGSTNFAIAGAHHADIEKYFDKNSSSSYKNLNEEVSLLYTQGTWSGELANDVVHFPTLNSVPKIACNIALIMESKNFFINGSDWQGILGLAYPSIARPSSNYKSWIDFLQQKYKDSNIAFSLTLCGSQHGQGSNDHVGSFEILNNIMHPYKGIRTAKIVREWFYEVVLTGLYIDGIAVPVECRDLNVEHTIIDSGTTNVRLPQKVFQVLVNMLIDITSNITINSRLTEIINKNKLAKTYAVRKNVSKEFWLNQEKACWSTPQTWEDMPIISFDLASDSDTYFRISITASSYIRLADDDAVKKGNYCYKFSIEPSDTGTILGVIAMEGFQVIFNRTSKTVGFLKADCGPNVSLQGPFTITDNQNLFQKCWHKKISHTSLLDIAGYIISVTLFFAGCMFLYLFVQCIKTKYRKYHNSEAVVSMSHARLINND